MFRDTISADNEWKEMKEGITEAVQNMDLYRQQATRVTAEYQRYANYAHALTLVIEHLISISFEAPSGAIGDEWTAITSDEYIMPLYDKYDMNSIESDFRTSKEDDMDTQEIIANVSKGLDQDFKSDTENRRPE